MQTLVLNFILFFSFYRRSLQPVYHLQFAMTSDGAPTQQPSSQNGASNGTPRTKVCVYCGSSGGSSPAHMEAARQLGKVMAANDIDLGESYCPQKSRLPKLT